MQLKNEDQETKEKAHLLRAKVFYMSNKNKKAKKTFTSFIELYESDFYRDEYLYKEALEYLETLSSQ